MEQTAICVFVKKRAPDILWHLTERTPGQQVEYLRKMEMVAQQISNDVFYKRVGFSCRQCEFLPLCLGEKEKTRDTLVKIA